jgi:hypothetical protein
MALFFGQEEVRKRSHALSDRIFRRFAAKSSQEISSADSDCFPLQGRELSGPARTSAVRPSFSVQIEPHRIACQEPAHDRCDRNGPGSQKQMHMVGHERPCVAGRSRLLKQTGQPSKEILPVLVILENLSSFDSSDDNVVQSTGRINSSLPWHAFQGPLWRQPVNEETTSPSLPPSLCILGSV